tara:strand:- start:4339 stop:6000 length:1662 start_codon:yes stop_codon:yes gene_type:complete
MKITFYSPNSFITVHSIPESVLIKELVKQGHKIHRVFCDGLYQSLCSSMSSSGNNHQSDLTLKKTICSKCTCISRGLEQIKGIEYHYVSKYLKKDKKVEIDEYIAKLSHENFSFKSDYFLNRKLKLKALYLTILTYKLNDLKLSKENFEYYKEKLRNSLYSFHVAQQLKKIIKSDLLFIYSPQYEINNFFYEGFKSKSLKTYFIEGSDNLFFKHSALRIWDWDRYKLESPVKLNWRNYELTKLPLRAKRLSEKHIKSFLKGKNIHVYSPSPKKKEIKFSKGFDLKKFKKVFLLSTSSYDESFAANVIGAFPDYKIKSKVFKNQMDWILYTIKFFNNYPEFGLIIRIHPREFSNRREGQVSNHYRQFLKIIGSKKLEANIYINYPNEKISIYDLFKVVDVTLASWSITAIESLIFGKKVITYDNKLTNYPDDIVISGSSVKEYYGNLKKIINDELTSKEQEFYKEKGLNWFMLNHYVNNLYIKINAKGFSFLMNLLKLSIKVNNKYLIWGSIFLNLRILKLNNFSRRRFFDMIKFKLDHLLSKDILLNKKFLKK